MPGSCKSSSTVSGKQPFHSVTTSVSSNWLSWKASERFGWMPKEPVAGILYAAGIWSGPAIVGTSAFGWPLTAACLHAAAATLNLSALGVFETEVDRAQGHRSLGLLFGRDRARRWIVRGSIMATAIALLVSLAAASHERLAFAVLAAQTAMPATMLLAQDWFGRRERYRSWGDSVFFLGALPRLVA